MPSLAEKLRTKAEAPKSVVKEAMKKITNKLKRTK